ncbi:hypothetical protein [Brucella sp. 10RB9215]|uniref:hypothetical protein n=1 Tax=Brucella sp. 10RB9215 TaxID=1149953 RepID=UPI0010FE14B2|nr:hypothetical protein [Brucella sp. 10RB9215]
MPVVLHRQCPVALYLEHLDIPVETGAASTNIFGKFAVMLLFFSSFTLRFLGKPDKQGSASRPIDAKSIQLSKDYGAAGDGVQVDDAKGSRNSGGCGYCRAV